MAKAVWKDIVIAKSADFIVIEGNKYFPPESVKKEYLRTSSTSFGIGGSTSIGSLPVTLGGLSKTPTEKAIRVCIQKAIEYIVSQTPAEYYRHK